MKESKCKGTGRWRPGLGVAAIGVLAFGVVAYGAPGDFGDYRDLAAQIQANLTKGRVVEIEPPLPEEDVVLPPSMADHAKSIERVPAGVPLVTIEVYDDATIARSGGVADAPPDWGPLAKVFSQPNDSGYGHFKKDKPAELSGNLVERTYFQFGRPAVISMLPLPYAASFDAAQMHTFTANQMYFGGGFEPGDTIVAYEALLFTSTSIAAGPATFRLSLWDGDPFGVDDIVCSDPVVGPQPIPGTTVMFTDVPAASDICPPVQKKDDECVGLNLLKAVFKNKVVINCDHVWMVVENMDTCRTGWRIAGTKDPQAVYNAAPQVGMSNRIESLTDCGYYAECGPTGDRFGKGTCCDTGAECDDSDQTWPPSAPECSHASYCSDDAEMGDLWSRPDGQYASYVANIYAQAKVGACCDGCDKPSGTCVDGVSREECVPGLAPGIVHPVFTLGGTCKEGCKICPGGEAWVDGCPAGEDVLDSQARVGIDLDGDCIGDTALILSGPVRVSRSDPDPVTHSITTEITDMTLTSASGVTLRAGTKYGLNPSMGVITQDPNCSTLAESSFDVFFEIDLGPDFNPRFLYNDDPHFVRSVITNVPPCATYTSLIGNPCLPLRECPDLSCPPVAWLVEASHTTPPRPEKTHCGPGDHWVDSCAGGVDALESTQVLAGIDLDLDPLCGADTKLVFNGDLVINRSCAMDDSANFPGTSPDPNDGHLDVIDTEIAWMDLIGGGGIRLTAGAGVGQGPLGYLLQPSLGAIVEQAGSPGAADSFFDVFFEIDLGSGQYIYNHDSARVEAKLEKVPPKDKRYLHISGCVPLFTSGGVHVANLGHGQHCIGPPCPDRGACCDKETGNCRNDVLPPPQDCAGPQEQWHKDMPCSAVVCEQHRGACCDGTTGICVDDVLPGDCVGGQLGWFKDTSCSAVSCQEHTGACCVEGVCTDAVPQSACASAKWFKDTPCDDSAVVEVCEVQGRIPTVSQWGIAIMALLLLVGAKVYFGRRRAMQA